MIMLHCGRKHVRRHCFQAFSSEEILKCYIKDCLFLIILKINGKQRIKMLKKGC